MSGNGNPFQYFLSQKNGFVVVSLLGEVNLATSEALDACLAEVKRLETATYVVINMSGVTAISQDAVSAFAKLQKEIRLKPAELRICSLGMSLKEKLSKLGVIRNLEVVDSLDGAIMSLFNFSRNKPKEPVKSADVRPKNNLKAS